MTDPALLAATEDAISKYSEWLRLWHTPDDPEFNITREDYDAYDDPPRILGAVEGDHTLVVLYVNPFHDEGGHQNLIIALDYDNGHRVMGLSDVLPSYTVCQITQDFDTYLTEIYNSSVPEPGFRNVPEPEKAS
jgi:hypothetical protein